MSFDERSHKLATFAVESSGRLGLEGTVAISSTSYNSECRGGRDGASMAREGVLKERLLRIASLSDNTGGHFEASVPLQAIQLRDRQERCKKDSSGKG